jgi:CDP-6-deoxy-D-xylo-4-hexulose-3-dehydrase
MAGTFWIGVHPGLDEEKLEFIASQIETFFGIGF